MSNRQLIACVMNRSDHPGEICSEAMTYVSNIYEFYVAYKLMNEHGTTKHKAVETALSNKRV
jgi:hypothetical protein